MTALDVSTLQMCALWTMLVPLVLAGMALMNVGFGRARGASHAMVASLTAVAVAALVYCFCGAAVQGFRPGASHVAILGGKPWDWLGGGPLLLSGLRRMDSGTGIAVLLQIFSVGIAALIPISTGADRWRLRGSCLSSALLAGFIFPLFAHWVWGGGWLAQLGSNYGLGHGFVDAGGAGTIQAVGGVSALAVAWLLGPRRGKYAQPAMPAAIPGHNIVYVLFGCAVMTPGWIALNCAGAVLWNGAMVTQAPWIAVNTVLAAAAASLATVAMTRVRFGKPDASLCANGWVGGLVASSAVCAFVGPVSAMVVGLVAGVLVTFAVELLELRLGVDDAGGAISVHAVCGLWGLFSLGTIAWATGGLEGAARVQDLRFGAGQSGQLLAQLMGIATLVGCILPLAYGLNWMLDRLLPQRVEVRGERLGMDLHELGAGAYPEFVLHSDEFSQR